MLFNLHWSIKLNMPSLVLICEAINQHDVTGLLRHTRNSDKTASGHRTVVSICIKRRRRRTTTGAESGEAVAENVSSLSEVWGAPAAQNYMNEFLVSKRLLPLKWASSHYSKSPFLRFGREKVSCVPPLKSLSRVPSGLD